MVMQAVSDVDGGAIDFEDLYLAERARLVRAMLLLTGRVGEAEDLAQDAFVRVYERWPQIREMDSPTGYLYRTAMNLNRSRLRKLVTNARRAVGTRQDTSGDPAAAVEARDQVDRALRVLTMAEREALVLVEWMGLSPEAAGSVLGIRAVSVRVRLSRAKASVQRSLEESDE